MRNSFILFIFFIISTKIFGQELQEFDYKPLLTAGSFNTNDPCNLYNKSLIHNTTSQKPTTNQQRLITKTTSKYNATEVLQSLDSTNYIYSGNRYTVPILSTYTPKIQTTYAPDMRGAFDSFYEYIAPDLQNYSYYSFSTFNSRNLPLHQSIIKQQGNILATIIDWQYYSDDTILKTYTAKKYYADDLSEYTFNHIKRNESGKATYDSVMQFVPSYPNSFLFNTYEYTYDNNGRIIHQRRNYDNMGTADEDWLKEEYYISYNGSNTNIDIDSIVSYSPAGISIKIYHYYYNIDGNLNKTVITKENGDSLHQQIYIYNNNNISQQIDQDYQSGTWVNTLRYNYAYTSGVLNKEIFSNWNSFQSEWSEQSRINYYLNSDFFADSIIQLTTPTFSSPLDTAYMAKYYYNDFNNIDSISEYSYVSANLPDNSKKLGSINVQRNYYTIFDDVSAINNAIKNNININVFPNPSSGEITIKIPPEEISSQLKMNIYDLTGRLVTSQVLDKTINNAYFYNTPNGIYILKIRNGKGNKNFASSIVLRR